MLTNSIALALLATLSGAGDSAPQPGQTFRDCADCPEMVVIPSGSFHMGAEGGEPQRYEGPVRPVKIDYNFAVAVTPVTNAEFRRFTQETGYEAGKDCWIPLEGKYKQMPGTNWQNPGLGREIRDNEPVICVNWRDAQAFVGWLKQKTGKSYRLLSEAEWEYTARAGDTSRFPWGEDPEGACKSANLLDASAPKAALVVGQPTKCSDGYATLSPVDAFPPNAFGVRDMIGNVWTWVQDCYVMPYPADVPSDGSAYEGGACERRSVRGASWGTTTLRSRATFRGRDPETLVSQVFGFRIARDLP